MKKRISALSLMALTLVLLALPALALPKIGEKAPDFTLKTLSGDSEVKLSDLQGKVVYIDFWASWCGPCRRSFPEVKKLQEAYADQGMEVLAISLDKSPSPAIRFMAQQDTGFLGLFDEGSSTALTYGVKSIPTTIILGPDGKVAFSMVGFNPNKVGDIKKTIEGLLPQVETPEEDASVKSM